MHRRTQALSSLAGKTACSHLVPQCYPLDHSPAALKVRLDLLNIIAASSYLDTRHEETVNCPLLF